ncbi:hypothetical protein RB195_013274 [Necator americanus]|nr:hypothetical protein NECAME_16625 [Necator americanus]ETN85831.1 hypothetical protein NECAME_16625 [Necator americanus]
MHSSAIVMVTAWLVLQTSADNMFNEYFKRGMYECALDYLNNLQEIHRYVQRASTRQQECRKKAALTDKTFPKTNIAPLDEFIESMRQEEEEESKSTHKTLTKTL